MLKIFSIFLQSSSPSLRLWFFLSRKWWRWFFKLLLRMYTSLTTVRWFVPCHCESHGKRGKKTKDQHEIISIKFSNVNLKVIPPRSWSDRDRYTQNLLTKIIYSKHHFSGPLLGSWWLNSITFFPSSYSSFLSSGSYLSIPDHRRSLTSEVRVIRAGRRWSSSFN